MTDVLTTPSLAGGLSLELPASIVKRDGRIVPFDLGRIEAAVQKCFASIGAAPAVPVPDLAHQVGNIVAARWPQPTVEQVQDTVEMVLQAAGEYEAAKHYILYRAEHAAQRAGRPVPPDVRSAFDESARYFPAALQQFQFYDKYARFNYDLGRRETWVETVDRAVDFLAELSDNRLGPEVYEPIRRAMLEMKAMTSMRLLAMAGEAARRDHVAIYNCSYMPVSDLQAFSEALLISMAGCGVGYSVERRYVENLPRIRRQKENAPVDCFVVPDTAEGWSQALSAGLATWFDGRDITFDYSQLRPAGAPLRIKGGRSSGPEALRRVLNFARARILARQGTVLRPLDAHDLMCAVGGAAVSGGVRRTALISLFDFDDDDMRHAKDGDFERENSQRWNANNSAVWPDDLGQGQVIDAVREMARSGRGEPGIFSRAAMQRTRPARRALAEFGCNPCGEVSLSPHQFCNLSIAVARADDTYDSLRAKVEIAAVIGTIQSLATHFRHLRPEWQRNCEEERLLGVDINGQMDSAVAQDAQVQRRLREVAVEVNRRTAEALGINPSAAVTCVKPSGNSAVLFDCSSGLHARWSPYYIRNVRVAASSPLFKVLRDAGAPMDPENGQLAGSADTWVVHFPVAAPAGAVTRRDRTALEQCDYWLQVKTHYTEHNPSVTITYEPNEEIELLRWIWAHRELIGGMTFFPADESSYAQQPYVEITRQEYEQLAARFPVIDFAKVFRYEETDLTTAAQELACSAGLCEIDLAPRPLPLAGG